MEWKKVKSGYLLRADAYEARLFTGERPFLRFTCDGRDVADLPAVSVLGTPEKDERLCGITVDGLSAGGEGASLALSAWSSIWETHRFEWRFSGDTVEYTHRVTGAGALGHCCFFSCGIPGTYDYGTGDGYAGNAQLRTERYFSPVPNHVNRLDYDIAECGYTGMHGDCTDPLGYRPDRMQIFSPSPLFYAFYTDSAVMGLGLGARPGEYRFNSFEYSGLRKAGAAFYINYNGYTCCEGEFVSPVVSLGFGAYSPYDALARYVVWLDRRGFSTVFRDGGREWYRMPIFCGWAEQTSMSERAGEMPVDWCTQENYERWLDEADARGIPYSTVVIDDKWQTCYGKFEIDRRKWPDMKRFVDRCHARGGHVLLWVPAHQAEGLEPELCVTEPRGGRSFADVGNPRYERMLRAQITELVREIGVDGFKEDWMTDLVNEPGVPLSGGLYGIEYVRRFQQLLWSAAHDAKPDAMLETQTPHPLFRESSDVLRLNDLWFGVRTVPDIMRARARIARICGWRYLDTDNASSTTADGWFAYAAAQVRLGTPALYFLNETESMHERPTEAMWRYLAALWREYIDENIAPDKEEKL